MTVIPNFILKRLYVNNSLSRTEQGVSFQIMNNLGPGMITKINHVKMGEQLFHPEQLIFEVDGQLIAGEAISEANPANFFLNQKITCHIKDTNLPAGHYEMNVDLVSKEAGRVVLSVQDQLAS